MCVCVCVCVQEAGLPAAALADRAALFKLRRAAAAAVRDLTVLEAAEAEVRTINDYYFYFYYFYFYYS